MKMNKVPVNPRGKMNKEKKEQIKKQSDEKLKLWKDYSIQFYKENAYGGGERSKKEENPHQHASYVLYREKTTNYEIIINNFKRFSFY